MKYLVLIFSAWMMFAADLFAQSGADYLSLAKKSLEEDQPGKAREEAERAIQAFQQEKKLSAWIQAQRTRAEATYAETQNPYDALRVTDMAMTNPFLKPATEEEYFILCKFITYQSWLAKEIGDFIRVKKDLEEAHRLFKGKLNGKYPIIANYLYAELGNAYVRLAEYEGAWQIFEENLQYSRQYPRVAKFNDYGNLYLNIGDFSRAIEIFQQGLAFNRTLPDTSKLPDAELKLLHLNIAESLAQMGRFQEALLENKQAEKSPLSTDDDRYERCLFGLYENYGIIYAGMAKSGRTVAYPLAVQWYKKALLAAKDTPNREQAGFQIALSEIYLNWGKPAQALENYETALKLLLPKMNGASIHPDMLFAEKKIILALRGKARAFIALKEPEKALECYELIPFVEAKLRAAHAYESSSLFALKESRQRFEEAIDLAWQLFEGSNGNPRFAERAFRLTELSRGMLLLQSLMQARQYLPEPIRNKDYELRVKMAWLEHEIAALVEEADPASKPKIDGWKNQLFELKQERGKLLADFPGYNNPDSVVLQVLAAPEVQRLLRPHQALIDYFLTDSTAYIFSFDASGAFRWRKAALPAYFRDQTNAFTAFLWAGEEQGRATFLQQASSLFQLLLAPEQTHWDKTNNSLMIVPDGVLMLTPFEVLLSSPTSNGSAWRDQPWLLKDFNIGYAYSATLLNVQQSISIEHEKAAIQPRYNVGGFAPAYSASGIYDLQNTGTMVEKVESMLGGQDWLGDASSEERFKKTALDYRVLLLAMHGISDAEHPELSRLLFGDPGPDTLVNNNMLYASELQIMRLQADLVVLSACHSGSGKLEQGEGVYSLARAFAAARVPASVMSLWLLHENTAPPLIEAFFKYLQQGKTKDEALRLAKLEFLKKDEHFEMTHPFYWAGLAALGDMRALKLPSPSPLGNPSDWIILAVISLSAGIWWLSRRRNSNPKL